MTALYVLLSLTAGMAGGWWWRDQRSGDPIRKHPRGMDERDPYRLCERMLTTPEAAFFESLQASLPDGYHVLAKVRLSDVLNVSYGAADRGEAHARINSKRLDFLVCDETHLPVLAFLLGEPDDRRTRDYIERVCGKVGLELKTVNAQPAYAPTQVRLLTDSLAGRLAA